MRDKMIKITRMFGILTVFLLAVPARADNIDVKLFSETPEILKSIRKQGYKSVGVLHFRCQKGDGREGFNLGTIPGSMAQRLENAMIVHMETDSPIPIAHDA